MGNKVFISYKYSDNSVLNLKPYGIFGTTARDYVDIIQKKLKSDGIHIYKGENNNESLADFKTETIRSELADRIFDSSVTIVLVSPNMKDIGKAEKDQWIPWEIAYSLRNKSRSDNKSKRNAILLVILPDKSGSYNYVESDYFNPHSFYFDIIQKNLDNLHTPYTAYKLKNNCSKSYMLRCKWNEFISNPNGWIEAAIEIRNKQDKYNIVARP